MQNGLREGGGIRSVRYVSALSCESLGIFRLFLRPGVGLFGPLNEGLFMRCQLDLGLKFILQVRSCSL